MSLRQALIEARRQSILRLLAEYADALNEAVLRTTIRRLGFTLASAEDIGGDLDHLARHGCLDQRWEGDLRVVALTLRGEDCAYGRIAVEGVESTKWRR
jgi:hypothetical protein